MLLVLINLFLPATLTQSNGMVETMLGGSKLKSPRLVLKLLLVFLFIMIVEISSILPYFFFFYLFFFLYILFKKLVYWLHKQFYCQTNCSLPIYNHHCLCRNQINSFQLHCNFFCHPQNFRCHCQKVHLFFWQHFACSSCFHHCWRCAYRHHCWCYFCCQKQNQKRRFIRSIRKRAQLNQFLQKKKNFFFFSKTFAAQKKKIISKPLFFSHQQKTTVHKKYLPHIR